MYGFSLLPDASTEQQLVAWNNTHLPEPLTLDTVFTKTHVTLVQAPFRKGFSPKEAMGQLAEQFKFIPETHVGDVKQEGDYVMVSIANPAWLAELNRLAVNLVKDDLDLTGLVAPESFGNPAQKESWETTGYKYNLEAYDPHFTVGITSNPSFFSPTGLEGKRVSFRKLVFSEHGPHGRISRIIESVPLPFSWD